MKNLTQDQIETVVDAFYAKVRLDPVLGPVFAAHVQDWAAHTEKISRFWRNAILRDPVYSGNPMRKHSEAGNVETWHFDLWLALFDETLREHLPFEHSAAWSNLAHRIGRSLQMGLEVSKVPRLA